MALVQRLPMRRMRLKRIRQTLKRSYISLEKNSQKNEWLICLAMNQQNAQDVYAQL